MKLLSPIILQDLIRSYNKILSRILCKNFLLGERVSRTPLVQHPTIDCSLQVQRANGAILLTQQNHQSPSLLPRELTNNTSTLQVVEPPALLRMGLPDPALPAGEPTQAGVNRCQWRCRPHTTSSPHKVLYVHPPLSKQWNHKP